MIPSEVTLSFGSNLGDRKGNIEKAVEMVSESLCCPPVELSKLLETKAIGFDGPDFLDCVGVFRTAVAPQELLHICKRIEKELGRTDDPEFTPDGSRIYHSRPIDIDILFYADERIDTPTLTIPHPQVKNREYIKELLLSLPSQKNRTI